MTTRHGEPFTEWGYRIHYPMQREVAIVGERSGRMDGQQEREAALTRESWPVAVTAAGEVIYRGVATVEDKHGVVMRPTESVADILRPLAEEPDPCFDALRRPIFASDYVTGPGIQGVLVDGRPWTLDASMGAIVRAMGACDLVVTFLSASGLAQIDSMTYRPGPMRWHGDGATPEEGLARALVAAWREKRSLKEGP